MHIRARNITYDCKIEQYLAGLVAVGQCSQLQQFLGKYESTDKRENTAAIAAATGRNHCTVLFRKIFCETVQTTVT